MFLFQFLMVRLKEIYNYFFKYQNIRFQFLMVRLKDRSRRAQPRTTIVSIPYGTIKSFSSSVNTLFL